MHKNIVLSAICYTIGEDDSRLLGDQRFSIDEAELNNACPFYCIVSNNGVASAAGSSLLKLLGIDEKGFIGHSIDLWLEVDDEDGLSEELSLASMASLRQRPFKLIARGSGVQLACEVVSVKDRKIFPWRFARECLLMIMRPLFSTYAEVEEVGLSLQDFGLTDPIRTNLLSMLMEESLREDLMSALGDGEVMD